MMDPEDDAAVGSEPRLCSRCGSWADAGQETCGMHEDDAAVGSIEQTLHKFASDMAEAGRGQTKIVDTIAKARAVGCDYPGCGILVSDEARCENHAGKTWPPDGDSTGADPVDPPHYKRHPNGLEAIEVCEHLPFNLGNAMKYLWRVGFGGKEGSDCSDDLRKAIWYIEREIDRNA